MFVSAHSLNLVRIREKGSPHPPLQKMSKQMNEGQDDGGLQTSCLLWHSESNLGLITPKQLAINPSGGSGDPWKHLSWEQQPQTSSSDYTDTLHQTCRKPLLLLQHTVIKCTDEIMYICLLFSSKLDGHHFNRILKWHRNISTFPNNSDEVMRHWTKDWERPATIT